MQLGPVGAVRACAEELGGAVEADHPQVLGDAFLRGDRTHAADELGTELPDVRRDVEPLALRERRARRGEADGLRTVRLREQEDAFRGVAKPSELHDLALAREHRDRVAVADRLTPCREVGVDAVAMVRAAQVEADRADHLVEDQNGALALGQRAQALEVALVRLVVLHRLEDHRGDLSRVLREELAECVEVVVGERDRRRVRLVRDAAGHRCRADEPVVDAEEGMVAAVGDELAAGRCARELDRRSRDVGTVLAELDHLSGRPQVDEILGELELEDAGAREIQAAVDLLLHSAIHRRMVVPERDHAVAHAPVDEAIAVDVPAVRAFGARHHARRPARELILALAVRVAAAGNDCVEPLRKLEAAREGVDPLAHQPAWVGRRDSARRRSNGSATWTLRSSGSS